MFNTLRYANMLEEVGFSRDQAEMSVKILVEIMEDKLASKHDLQELKLATQQDFRDVRTEMSQMKTELQHSIAEVKTELQHSIAEVKTELQYSIAQSESKLTIRMGTMLAASIAILTAIQKLV